MIDSKKYDIIDKALNKLAKIKNINLFIDNQYCTATKPDCINLLLRDFSGFGLWVEILDSLFDTPRQVDEPQNLPFEDILILRVAKIIFDTYKAAQGQPLFAANNLSATLNSIDVTAIDTACNKVNDIEQEINDARIELVKTKNDLTNTMCELDRVRMEKNQLENTLRITKSKVDQVVQVLLDKGILDVIEVID